MELTVLGCSGTFPGPASACSGYLVEADGFRVLLDVGNGVLGPLGARGLLDVDAVVVSHLHADHVVDLVPYAYARHFHPDGSAPQLTVHGPAGTRDRVSGLYDGPPGSLDRTYAFDALLPSRFELGPFVVAVERMNHPVETFGVRLEHAGASLAYSADTDATPGLDRLAAGVDLLLCEASFLHGHPNPPGVHLTGRQAGEVAARAGVGELLLTHLVPWHDPGRPQEEAVDVFDGPVSTAASATRRVLGRSATP